MNLVVSLNKGKKMPIGTISHGRKKIAEGSWVTVKKKSKRKKKVSQDGTLPLDVHALTESSAITLVKQAAKMPLKTLRRNQDIVEQQKEKAYKKKNLNALDRLEVMGDIYTAAVMIKEFKESTPKEWGKEIVSRISRMDKSIGEDKMNLVISMENARKKVKKSISNDVVLMPTELLKAQHLGKVQGAKNAKGTVPPKDPEGSRGAKPSKGAPPAESSKKGGSQKRVPGRKPVKPPYKGEVWIVSGMASDAANNYLVVTSKDSNKTRYLKLGTKHKAKFDHAGNIIKIKVDAKSYPVQNHLVRVPSGVFSIAGSPSVAGKVTGANK